MAGRIPQYERQIAAQANRRVVDIPVANYDTGEGRTLKQVGEAVGEFGRRINDAQRDEQLARADRTIREKLDRLKLDIENDRETPDEKLEEKFSTEAQKIVDETGKIIGSEPVRKLWNERALGFKADGGIWANKLGRTRQVDKVRAGHVETANQLDQQVGDPSVSAETFAANLAGEKALIARNAQRGFYSEEQARELTTRLDNVAVKDRMARTSSAVENLLLQGDTTGAEMLVAEFDGNGAQREALKKLKEGVERDIKAKANQAEAEKRKAEILASNAFEMDVLGGKAGYAQLQAKVEKGEISVNDQPALFRAIRAENDRKENEAKQAKMSAEMKAMLADRSADYRLGFDAFSTSNPAQFMGGYDKWNEQYRAFYDRMTPDDQRAIDRKQIEMAQTGQTASAAKMVYGLLEEEAKRVVPDWSIGSTAKGAPKQGAEFAGKLYAAAEQIAAQNGGGKDLTVDQVRSAVARALDAYQPGKWDNLPTNIYDNEADKVNARLQAGLDPAYDYQAEQQIRDAYYEKYGRSIPDAELKAYYAAAKGGK